MSHQHQYDFDRHVPRRATASLKHDGMGPIFGRDDLTPLWVADMDFEACPAIVDALSSRLDHRVLGYAVTPDSYWDSITVWLKRRHGWDVERQELTFMPGVIKGVAYAINFFTRPGDKVVIQTPVYHPFRMVVEGNGRRVLKNPLINRGDSYAMDLEGLNRLAETEKPRMMILCNPHNPVGIQWDEPTLREVGSIARRNGMVVVSDEIHGDLMLDGRPHLPMAAAGDDARAVTITLGAPSKTFNIPGMVSSWMVVKDKALREPFYAWLAANEFNDPPMMSVIAAEAAYRHGEAWLDELIEYLQGNIATVKALTAELMPAVKVVDPQASFLVWLDFRALGLSQPRLMEFLADDCHLALTDGMIFGDEGQGYARLNIAEPRAEVAAAVRLMASRLKDCGLLG